MFGKYIQCTNVAHQLFKLLYKSIKNILINQSTHYNFIYSLTLLTVINKGKLGFALLSLNSHYN